MLAEVDIGRQLGRGRYREVAWLAELDIGRRLGW